MGTVYRAFDESRGFWVALKRIRAEAAQRPEARARFLREARSASRLDHPGIVKVYDFFSTRSSDWIVMELAAGQTLDALLGGESLDLTRVLALATEIAEALAAAHAAGIVHRDLKPKNIMVDPEGHAKILDFGLAKQIHRHGEMSASISIVGQLIGTPHSMSPEQAMGLDVDLRSDLFSFGTLLYEMATGTSPFLGSNCYDTLKRVCTFRQVPPCELNSEIPTPLGDLIDRLLEKEPAHRPQTAREVVLALQRIAAIVLPRTAACAGGRKPLSKLSGAAGACREPLDTDATWPQSLATLAPAGSYAD